MATKPEPNNKTPQKGALSENYVIKKKLGKGNFAVVRLVQNKATKNHFAAKIIKKKNLKPDELAGLNDEVDILKTLDHANINKLIEVYDTKHHLYIVLELLTGGELFERIVSKKFYSEEDAAKVMHQIASGCKYMHARDVIHRDLKPENLIYETKENNSLLKITDFGLAKLLNQGGDLMKTACGTPGYVAPEVLKKEKYRNKVDMWSCGVILYILLCGFPPFHDKNLRGLYKIIKKGKYSFPSPYWDKVSSAAKDCVQKLLVVKPEKRLSAVELLEHPWVAKQQASKNNLVDQDGGLMIKNLKNTIYIGRFKRGVRMVLFLNRLKNNFSSSMSGDKPAVNLPNIEQVADSKEAEAMYD